MLFFRTFITVAQTEAKLFTRSWLFRFLALITVLFTGFFMWGAYIQDSNWLLKSLPSGFPYSVFLLLTILESLIVIFGSIESIQRDRQFDTIASLHTRSFSNCAYILGKAAGVLLPCLILNMVFLAAAVIAKLCFITDTSFVWQDFLFYPLVISVPSLLFITGLSFLVTGVFRSKALSMFLLVGLYVLTFLYRDSLIARMIDFNAMQLPLLASTVVGLPDLGAILFQRAVFLFFGIGSVLATGLLFARLPQSVVSTWLSRIVVLTCMLITAFAGSRYINGITRGTHLRERIVALNEEYVSRPRARLAACDLDIVHRGSSIDATAMLTLRNHRGEGIDSIILSLNPGFIVRSVVSGETELTFTRDTQIIEVDLPAPLASGAETVLTVTYDGTVDDAACYPDVDPAERIRLNRVAYYVIGSRCGFITDDYMLLTPECQWYPVSGIPYGMVFPAAQERDFTAFTADIKTGEDLVVVSQGMIEKTGPGTFTVRPDTPLSGLTITAGNFEKQAVMVDSVEVAMYLFEGHDYFTEGHPLSKEQICAIIAEEKNRYEVDRGMDYPFTRYVLVETPVQFDAWDRPWETHVESIQPQMALVPELGYYQTSLNKRYLSVSWYYSTGGMDDIEQRAKDMIRNVIGNTLMNDQRQRTVARETRSRNYKPIDNTWLSTTGTYRVPGYTFSAHFYPFLVSFESERYPIINAVMEFQRKHGFLNDSRSAYRLDHPLLDTEITCTWLDSCSVAEHLENGVDFDTLNQLLIVKSNQLFGTIQAASGGTGFDMFLNEFITDHAFESVSYDEFADAANARFGIDMDRIFEDWYVGKGVPMFETSDISLTEIVDGEYTLYQTMLTLTNTEPVTGTVLLELGGAENIDTEHGTRFVTLDGHQSKQIAFLTDTPPPHLTVDCLVAKNLPLKLTRHLGTPAVDHRAEPFEGERVVPYSQNIPESGTIVVDNLDAGFEIISEAENTGNHSYGSIWDSYTKVPGDFDPPLFRLPLKRWSKAVFNSSFGRQSIALFTIGGDGDGAVAWHADIPEPGRYDLEYYFLDTEVEDLNRYTSAVFGRGNSTPFLADYNLTVSYADSEDSIEFMPTESRPGWQYVATFDLEPGQVDVVLSNKSEGILVYADAIRWVKK